MRRQRRGARSRDVLALGTLSIAMCVSGCRQGASARATKAATRAKSEAVVRQTETVKRVTIPKDSGRVLYDAPTDLSLVNALRTKATIVGIDSSTQPREPTQHGGAPVRSRP